MMYREIAPPPELPAVPSSRAILRNEIQVDPTDHDKYAIAIYPDDDSVTWYFLTPNGEVWINGLDHCASVKGCIALFNDIDLARNKLPETLESFTSKLGGIFKAIRDQDGNLGLHLIETYGAEY